MKKYYAFSKMLEFMSQSCEISNANMDNWRGNIEITGEDDTHKITIEVIIEKKKEEQENAEVVE